MNQEFPSFWINKNKFNKIPLNQSQDQYQTRQLKPQAEYFGDMIVNEEQQVFQVRQDGLNFISAQKKVYKSLFLQNYGFELSISKFSPKENYCAVGLMDGSLGIVNMRNTMKSFTHPIWNKVPLTAMDWFDNNTIYIANTEGVLSRVQIFDDSKRKFEISDSIWQDKEDQILTLAINKELSQIAIAGKRANINLLDMHTNQEIRRYYRGSSFQHGHTNRIFKVIFNPNSTTFFTGGWDQTVFQWDTRTQKPISSFFGPCISGDAMDIQDNMILTGSYKEKNSLEIWDKRNLQKICDVNQRTKIGNPINYISSCSFSTCGENQGSYIIAGSSMNSVVGIYKRNITFSLETEVQGVSGAVYTTDLSKEETKFLFGTYDGKLYVYKMLNEEGNLN